MTDKPGGAAAAAKPAVMPFSVISAAVTASFVGFGSSVAIILEAARAVGASEAEASTWVGALCVGIVVISLVLCVRHRVPAVAAWSTPGAALIASSADGIGLPVAVGAFIVAAVLMVLLALIRPFGRLMERLPTSLASAMLAGVLVDFCLKVVGVAGAMPAFVLPLVAVFFAVHFWKPTLAVPAVLLGGLAAAGLGGMIATDCCTFAPTAVVVTAPEFDLPVMIGLGVPLFLVTLAAQNLTGLAVLKASGYVPPARSTFAVTGLSSLLLAPFAAHGVNLAAITLAICAGPGCHPDPSRRWLSGFVVAACYVVLALFAGSFVELLLALPAALITTIAGLALFAPLKASLVAALTKESGHVEAAALTFVVAASGVNFLGVGSAIWGLAVGLVILGAQRIVSGKSD